MHLIGIIVIYCEQSLNLLVKTIETVITCGNCLLCDASLYLCCRFKFDLILSNYLYVQQVSDDDEYPKMICCSCKCQLDMIVKFIDTLWNGQMFLKNLNKMYKPKQFMSTEYNIVLDDDDGDDNNDDDDERITNFKNNCSTKLDNTDCIQETCSLTLADKNDLKTLLKNHCGNK